MNQKEDKNKSKIEEVKRDIQKKKRERSDKVILDNDVVDTLKPLKRQNNTNGNSNGNKR